jgi:hypothetical protein
MELDAASVMKTTIAICRTRAYLFVFVIFVLLYAFKSEWPEAICLTIVSDIS